MRLLIKRFEFAKTYTVGKLYVNGIYYCYTLEDTVRPKGEKIDGQTAISVGTYSVIIDVSNRFKRRLPHVLNVSGFEGVRIHTGNSSADTEGCILLGTTWAGKDFIGNSKIAFDPLFAKMELEKTIELIIE